MGLVLGARRGSGILKRRKHAAAWRRSVGAGWPPAEPDRTARPAPTGTPNQLKVVALTRASSPSSGTSINWVTLALLLTTQSIRANTSPPSGVVASR